LSVAPFEFAQAAENIAGVLKDTHGYVASILLDRQTTDPSGSTAWK